MSMKAVVFYGKNHIRLEERPVPVPAAGEARLRVLQAGICSTDFHIAAGHFPVRAPRVLGHELAGVVDAVGPGVAESWLGKPCGVQPARFCGACAPCRSGAPELCARFECLGNTHDGGLAEYTLAPVDQLLPWDGGALERAVWLEPLACVLQAIRVVNPAPGEHVLVLGAGVLGKLMVQAFGAQQEVRLAVVDPNADKVEQALEQGAEAGWVVPRSGPAEEAGAALRDWAPGGPQVVVDTTGAPAAIERSVRWAGPRARILLFGVSSPQARVSIEPSLIFSKELLITASAGMTPAAFAEAAALLRSGELAPEILVSQIVELEQAPAILSRKTGGLGGKVLVQPGGAKV